MTVAAHLSKTVISGPCTYVLVSLTQAHSSRLSDVLIPDRRLQTQDHRRLASSLMNWGGSHTNSLGISSPALGAPGLCHC